MSRFNIIAILGICSALNSLAWSQSADQQNQPREWHDPSGRYSVTASFVNADEDLVVLESNDQLLVVSRNELSDEDREFVKARLALVDKRRREVDLDNSRDTNAETPKIRGFDSSWTLRDGETVKGSLIGFGYHNYVVTRDRGKVFVDGELFDERDSAIRKIVPNLVTSSDKVEINNVDDLEDHLADKGGGPLTYRAEGIQVVLETGDTVTLPIAILNESEMEDVLPGFRRWKASLEEGVAEEDRSLTSNVERLLLRTYGNDPTKRLLRQQRKLQFLQLGLLAADVGATDLWQVALHSGRPYTYPYLVLVPAENSLIAQRRALLRFPGWKAVGARQLDN